VLKDFGFTGTLYIPTAFVEKTSLWLQDEGEGLRSMVNWDQLSEICNYGIECGSHSHTHPQLDRLTTSAARKEIILSKQILQEHLSVDISSFAFPYGFFNSTVKKIVRETGYSSACAVKYQISSYADDHFALSRLLVTSNTDIVGLNRILTRHTSIVTRMIRQVREIVANLLRRQTNYSYLGIGDKEEIKRYG